MPRHLLATNDFPPKLGGIQSYLWELWRRFDPETCAVVTASSDPAWESFDAQAAMPIDRVSSSLLYLPTPGTLRAIKASAKRHDAGLILLDPALPLGLLGARLDQPYGLVLHGAEITVPGRLPIASRLLAKVLSKASVVIAAGGYPLAEAERVSGPLKNVVQIPPGVDTDSFTPLEPEARAKARAAMGFGPDELVVASVSRLVPRKGMDTLIHASAKLHAKLPNLKVAIAGGGRDRDRLDGLVKSSGAPVRMLGRISEGEKLALLQVADLFVMACRDRWAGLEQEGFGIVFLEAAACGTPQIAGRSGGAHEAVEHGITGLVCEQPSDADALAAQMATLLEDPALREQMGKAARARAVAGFSYGVLAPRLEDALAATMRSGR